MKKFKLIRKVWLWPGQNPWHFVYVDGKIQDDIISKAKKHHMGMIRVQAQIGRTIWETSLLPFKKENCYLLAIKKDIRKKEDVVDGDTVTIILEPILKHLDI